MTTYKPVRSPAYKARRAARQKVRHLFEWHDLQRTSVTLGQYEKEIARTIKIVGGKGHGVHEINSHREIAA
jgi:hypothetical protein